MESKKFTILIEYALQVLWFSASRSHTIIYMGLDEGMSDEYVAVPHTNVIIGKSCLDECQRLFKEKKQDLIGMGALPPTCSNTLPATIRKFLDVSLDSGRKRGNSADAPFSHETRVLVVDDDPQSRGFVKMTLNKAGYAVNVAASGQDCLAHITKFGLPHLAILDLHMPKMTGIELGQEIKTFSDLPIMMLTANNEPETVASAIEQFAEDYIIKPAAPKELRARVARILNRYGRFAYRLGPWTNIDEQLKVDFVSRRVMKAGTIISLTPRETKLLWILMNNAGQIVTNEILLQRLAHDPIPLDHLWGYVYRLRKKIDSPQTSYIQTIRGKGYQFYPTNIAS